VEEGRDQEEACETGEVPHRGLRLDLLPEIQAGVGRQRLPARRRGPDDGERPGGESRLEGEVRAELLGEERVHLETERAAGEKVRPLALQFARARPAEREAESPFLDEAVDRVQEIRQPLHLVEDDPSSFGDRSKFLGEMGRMREEGEVDLFVEEVEARSVRQGGPDPGALPRPSGSEEEERLRGEPQDPRIMGCHVAVILRRNVTARSQLSSPPP
jgi:hypothetical protein